MEFAVLQIENIYSIDFYDFFRGTVKYYIDNERKLAENII